ncbi:MAG: hypothetical protein K0R47_1525 [Brevibacillus sp.]|nr:hypothetical protein [Brevibacillus sp.]
MDNLSEAGLNPPKAPMQGAFFSSGVLPLILNRKGRMIHGNTNPRTATSYIQQYKN